jgi:hypothetical protein
MQWSRLSFTRMNKFSSIIVAGLVGAGAGCRSPDSNIRLSESRRDDIANLKSNLRDYQHVLLVCIYEDRGPHDYSLHHFKATMVRAYKGDWSISERVAFVHGVDAPARSTVNGEAGTLTFLLTNEHGGAEVGVDTGEFYRDDRRGDRDMRIIFPTKSAVTQH